MKSRINLLRFDAIALSKHLDLSNKDICFHWREYTPGEDFNYSETNQLIHNFKISVLENKAKLKYKEEAIKKIAIEFCAVIRKETTYNDFTFVPIPPSKTILHKEYDNRLIRVFDEVQNLKQIPMDIRAVITQKMDANPAHASTRRLSIEELFALYEINQNLIKSIPKKVLVFDDVLTKGTHFKATQKILETIWPGIPIYGLFVARSIYS